MLTGSNGNFSVFGRGDAIIYINGRLVRNSSEVGQLASSDIKEVQVINNPGAQYGADVNAVIKIVTKKPVGEGFSLSAYTDNIYNKWFTTTEQLDLKYRTGGLEIFATGNFSHGKNYDDEYILSTTNGKSVLSMVSQESVSTTKTAISGKIGFNYQFNEIIVSVPITKMIITEDTTSDIILTIFPKTALCRSRVHLILKVGSRLSLATALIYIITAPSEIHF